MSVQRALKNNCLPIPNPIAPVVRLKTVISATLQQSEINTVTDAVHGHTTPPN